MELESSTGVSLVGKPRDFDGCWYTLGCGVCVVSSWERRSLRRSTRNTGFATGVDSACVLLRPTILKCR